MSARFLQLRSANQQIKGLLLHVHFRNHVTLNIRCHSMPFLSTRLIHSGNVLYSQSSLQTEKYKQQLKSYDPYVKKVAQALNDKDITNESKTAIRKHLNLLHNYGCDLTNIQNHLEVFNLSKTAIKKQAKKLKQAYITNPTPDLFVARHLSVLSLSSIALKQLKHQTGLDTREKLLQAKLKCSSPEEWDKIKSANSCKYRYLEFLRNYYMIEYLLGQGFTEEEIKSFSQNLYLNTYLEERLNWIHTEIPFVSHQLKVQILSLSRVDYTYFKEKLQEKLNFLCGCKTLKEAISKVEKIEQIIEKELDAKKRKNLKSLQEKIAFLRQEYQISDIVENCNCLMASLTDLSEKFMEGHHQSLLTIDFKKPHSKPAEVCSKSAMSRVKSAVRHLDETVQKRLQMDYNIDGSVLDSAIQEAEVKVSPETLYFFLDQGYSIYEITSNCRVLALPVDQLIQRLKIIHNVVPDIKPLLCVFLLRKRLLRKKLEDPTSFCKEMSRSYEVELRLKVEELSKMLNLSPSQEKLLDPIIEEKLNHLKSRIKYLKNIGITTADIQNDIFCLQIPMMTMVSIVQEWHDSLESRVENITLSHIIEKSHNSLQIKSKSNHNFDTVKRILGLMGKKHWVNIAIQKQGFTNSGMEMNENVILLIKHGFEMDLIRKLPYIIGHSSNLLEKYLGKLLEHNEMYSDIATDNWKQLNLLQLMIEQDHDFKPVVVVNREEEESVLNYQETSADPEESLLTDQDLSMGGHNDSVLNDHSDKIDEEHEQDFKIIT